MSWLGGRRSGRPGQKDLAHGGSLKPWGEAGPPSDYDPDAETGRLDLDQLSGLAQLTDLAGLADVGALVTAGSGAGDELSAGAGGEVLSPAESEGHGVTVPAPGNSLTGEDEHQGATIAELDNQMGYPREVVPNAQLVSTVSSGEGTELPHWADPPTGEVPRAIAGPHSEEDELQAWRLLGSRGLHWRDDVNDWSDGPGVEDLVDEDDKRSGVPEEATGDPFSFDEEFERLEHERLGRSGPVVMGTVDSGSQDVIRVEGAGLDGEAADQTAAISPDGPGGPGTAAEEPPAGGVVRTGRRVRRAARTSAATAAAPAALSARHTRNPQPPYDARAEEPGQRNRDVGAAVATGTVLVALLIICYLIGPVALLVFSAVAILGCALEAFSMLQRAGFRPATLLGVVGSAGAVLAAYWRGTPALPVVIAVVVGAAFLWYLARVVEARPVVNVAVTVLGFAWIGVLGSFAGLLLAARHGEHLFLGAVIPTVVADVVAWFGGSRFGSHPLAPAISPSKTWEGVVAGGIAALIAGAIIGNQLAPWGGARHGLELGLVVAVVAPIGDLVQSMMKRDLRVKDSGTLLPGHGGLLDRFDSLLFVLPATYFLATALHIVVY